MASRYELLNSIVRSLSPSLQTLLVSVLLSPMSSMYLPSVFSPPSPHCHSSFSSINPTASIHLSSMPATSLHLTVHLQPRPTIRLQSARTYSWNFFNVCSFYFYFCHWFCIHYDATSARNTSHPLLTKMPSHIFHYNNFNPLNPRRLDHHLCRCLFQPRTRTCTYTKTQKEWPLIQSQTCFSVPLF